MKHVTTIASDQGGAFLAPLFCCQPRLRNIGLADPCSFAKSFPRDVAGIRRFNGGANSENVACKGDGSDQAIAKVTISPQEIVSNVGVCTILDKKTKGGSISAHVECKFAGGPLIGDITFTPRPDNTIEFIDRDMTYKAVLHRCPQ
jgi:hypothetical protein